MTSIRLKEISMYHPSHSIHNEFFFEHFDKKGKDVRRLMEHVGREKRYQIHSENEKENGLTMAIESSKRVLEKANLSGRDIDMIIFCSQTPEQMIPMNALFVHQAIQASSQTVSFDMNSNCAGMVMAIEHASRYMLSNHRINRTLIVGTDQFSPIVDSEDEVGYTFFGDISVAAILERRDDSDEARGFIDAIHRIDSTEPDVMMFPANGLSTLLKSGSGSKLKMKPIDDAAMLEEVYASIREMLKDYQLDPADVKCCFSQNSRANSKKIQAEIGLKGDNMIFIADQFGYSGTTSPLLALHEGVKAGKIKRGDYILFWSIGTGYQFITMLYQY